MDNFWTMQAKDWAIVIAAILGPILAVQAQKIVEVFRERRGRKLRLFSQLMATRATRLSLEHVQGLNMIDVVFYGPGSIKVWNAWKEYLDHLGTDIGATEASSKVWNDRGDDLFINLLAEMSVELGYTYDRVHLKRSTYIPLAHTSIEKEQQLLRQALLSLTSGNHPLKMDVVSFPFDSEAAEAYKEMLKGAGKALENGSLKVDVVEKT